MDALKNWIIASYLEIAKFRLSTVSFALEYNWDRPKKKLLRYD
jgi:hypothetical protein